MLPEDFGGVRQGEVAVKVFSRGWESSFGCYEAFYKQKLSQGRGGGGGDKRETRFGCYEAFYKQNVSQGGGYKRESTGL